MPPVLGQMENENAFIYSKCRFRGSNEASQFANRCVNDASKFVITWAEVTEQ